MTDDRSGVFRSACILGCALTSVLSACSSYHLDSSAGGPGASAVINPPRSELGNPPFYEVFGERYFVMDSSAGYRERGVASWYGRDFHGQPTSGGEIYDMYSMTAAHKTLPIPTWVEVTNLRNGKRVMVKVNDRGPFVDDRLIDLSYRAAENLGMIGAGTALVEVRALGAPRAGPVTTDPELADATRNENRESGSESNSGSQRGSQRGFSIISEAVADTPGPDDRAFRQTYVQVGAFAERGNATRLADKLKVSGFTNSFVVTVGRGRQALHRVRIGPLDSEEQFDSINEGLRALGVTDSRLVIGN